MTSVKCIILFVFLTYFSSVVIQGDATSTLALPKPLANIRRRSNSGVENTGGSDNLAKRSEMSKSTSALQFPSVNTNLTLTDDIAYTIQPGSLSTDLSSKGTTYSQDLGKDITEPTVFSTNETAVNVTLPLFPQEALPIEM